MNVQSANGGSIRRYLLGELSEAERDEVEQRLMSDDDLYQQLLLAEDELIDEYISDALSEQERVKFSRRFLRVPELRQDVRSSIALRKYALKTALPVVEGDSVSPRRVSLLDRLRQFFMQPAIGVSFAAALLLAVLLATWLATQNSQLKKQVEQLQAQQTPLPATTPDLKAQLDSERRRNEQLSAELLQKQELLAEESRKLQLAREQQQQQQPTPTRSPASQSGVAAFVALTLSPGAIRDSGEWKKVSISPATRELRIQLDLPEGGYRSYRAVVRTVEGREVFSSPRLRTRNEKSLPLNIPARLLSPDDYEIQLSGVNSSAETQDIGSYYFRVLK
jgi:hypothetical protein